MIILTSLGLFKLMVDESNFYLGLETCTAKSEALFTILEEIVVSTKILLKHTETENRKFKVVSIRKTLGF